MQAQSRPAYAQPNVPTESRIFTVPQSQANREIETRGAFGWRLQSTSARSFNTGGNMVGASYGGTGQVMAGHIQMNAAHFTDITMYRFLDGRRNRVKPLEDQYDSLQERKPWGFWPWFLVAFLTGSFAFTIIHQAIEAGGADTSPAFFGFLVGPILAFVVVHFRNRPIHLHNAGIARLAPQLVEQARRTP